MTFSDRIGNMSDNVEKVNWGRHDEADLAVGEILDAAGRAFADLGVAKATMADLCRYAGCARSTLYRYFESRAALHIAYVNRAALRIAARLAAATSHRGSPAAVLTERILFGIRSVRDDPMLAIWFTPENMAIPIALSSDSEVLAALTAGFTDGLGITDRSDDEIRTQGQWLLRSIVSLLAMPADDSTQERTLVEHYIVPALLQSRSSRDRAGARS